MRNDVSVLGGGKKANESDKGSPLFPSWTAPTEVYGSALNPRID